MKARHRKTAVALLLALGLGGCQSPVSELSGLADAPPLDCAVLVTGGAYLVSDRNQAGTFAKPAAPDPAPGEPVVAVAPDEPIPMAAILEVLAQGRVFRRAETDPDPAHRRAVRDALLGGPGDPALQAFLQEARDRGFDLLLVVEELQDGPIEALGINGRWPVTFLTWILLGVGIMIPDHNFESRATLRVTVRDLQTGRVLHDPLLVGGPIELSLTERGNVWGLIESILVPPFWVGDDAASVSDAVRDVVQRRLLLSLARDLKSESVRQRLRERSAASLTLVETGPSPELVVESAESLSVVRLRAAERLDAEAASAFEHALLGSMQRDGERFRYRAPLPTAALGAPLQVLVGTIRGDVASATFAPGKPR